jgi:hypothetical protein
MRKFILISLPWLFCQVAFAQFIPDSEDARAIERIVTRSYVEAIHNLSKPENIDIGFHPGFDLLIMKDGQLEKYPIYNWKEKVMLKKSEYPSGPEKKITCRILSIDITGTAAVVKLQLFREQELLFTDYLSLYKFEPEWKIVSKIYYHHSEPLPEGK